MYTVPSTQETGSDKYHPCSDAPPASCPDDFTNLAIICYTKRTPEKTENAVEICPKIVNATGLPNTNVPTGGSMFLSPFTDMSCYVPSGRIGVASH